jgi:hypothetical protein
LIFFNKQTHYTSSLKNRILIGIILGLFLTFLIIFLEPFNTNEFEHSYRNIILSGYGVLLFGVFITQSFIENIWYYHINKIWLIRYEIISIIFFFIISGTVLYLYNHLFVNNLSYSVESHWRYYKNTIIVFIPIFSPLLAFLRHNFGERIIPISKNSIVIVGENKNEVLKLEKNELLYIKANENYIEIFFVDKKKIILSKIFRKTLSKIHKQLPFLEKCHRSFLVNINNIKEVRGNSQNAKITFYNTEVQIPLSKTLYKTIKKIAFGMK